jgi:hypothetical protein
MMAMIDDAKNEMSARSAGKIKAILLPGDLCQHDLGMNKDQETNYWENYDENGFGSGPGIMQDIIRNIT